MNDDLELSLDEIGVLDWIHDKRWAQTGDLPTDVLEGLSLRGLITIKTWAGRVALSPTGRDLYTQMGVGT